MPMRHSCLAYLLLILILMWGSSSPAAESAPELPLVKAAMVYNMVKYVDWPADAFAREDSPLLICSAGGGSMTSAMDSLRGKQLKGRQVEVRPVTGGGEIRSCHVLVLGDMEHAVMQSFITRAQRHSVLTVSDRNRFTRQGGVVGFYPQGNKLRFEINIETAQEHFLKISSQLLKLARIVRSGEP